jgi:hypothetical protein
MRLFSGLACAAACAAANGAAAQSPRPSQADDPIGARHALFGAVFADPSPAASATRKLTTGASSTFAVRSDEEQAAAAGGAFAAPAYSGTRLDTPTLLTTDRYLAGEGLVRWRTGETVLGSEGGTRDSLRLSVGGVARAPIGAEASDEAFDLTYTRGWISALRGTSGDLQFDITPIAGVGVSSAGGTAQAGAMVRLGDFGGDGDSAVERRLKGLVADGADTFGDRARWYLFAAGKGTAVGLNVMRSREGRWDRQGLSHDEGAFIGEAQVGLGWRKGDMQASFGLVHREIKTKPAEGLDEAQVEDQAIAFTLSIKPKN